MSRTLLIIMAVFFLTASACTPTADQSDGDRDHMMDDDMMHEDEDHMMDEDKDMMDREDMKENDSIRNRDMMTSMRLIYKMQQS